MLPDDVFRDRLEQTLLEIEAHIIKTRDVAAVDVAASARYWRIVVRPFLPQACPFELLINSDQKFSLTLVNETFENLPVERLDLFPALVRAIEAGRVDKIEMLDAKTGFLARTAMRVELAPGWDWLGEHQVGPPADSEEWRTHRYLAYRRQKG
jgi:hypothetical protein